MSERSHAILSPSSAHRWLRCTPSARYEEEYGDQGSIYAEEGTLAHELAELEVLHKLALISGDAYQARKAPLRQNPLYSKEMDIGATYYADYIDEIAIGVKAPYIITEIELDLSEFAPESFGTADCLIISGQTLHVIDYKYGRGVQVDAEDNEQLKLYALGALKKFGVAYDISTVIMHIVQPRLDHYTQAVITRTALMDWAKRIAPVARLAHAGEGDYHPGEKQCRFCKAKKDCAARNSELLDIVGKIDKAMRRTPPVGIAYKAKMLKRAKEIKEWLDDAEAEVVSAILAGEKVKGYKVVEGRSSRQITDSDGLVKAIVASKLADEELCYERKVLGITGFTALVGKKAFEEVAAPYIEKPQGKPKLVPDTYKRPDYIPAKPDTKEIFK